jgi:hypothetical protein
LAATWAFGRFDHASVTGISYNSQSVAKGGAEGGWTTSKTANVSVAMV